MKTYRNTNFTKRDYEGTNIVACQAEQAPGEAWELATEGILNGLTQLWIQGGVRYFGYL